MKSLRSVMITVFPLLAMAVLILDAKTALAGAQSGIELCVRVVIPSLFPFLFLSVMVTGSLPGRNMPLLRPLGALCRIPAGSESLLAVGLIGGYPVGAQSVTQAYREGRLSKESAHRMLGFCSNAGPSFIFGMLSGVFEPMALWALWGIHILSALLTGMLLPGGNNETVKAPPGALQSSPRALERSLKVMATICGLVVIFRVLLAFLQRWFLWMLPNEAGVLVSGLLELTNGCCRLQMADKAGQRFLLAAMLLGCGGACVGLQTVSVTEGLGTGLYFPGKAVQTVISALLSLPIQYLLFPAGDCFVPEPAVLIASAAAAIGIIAVKTAKIRSSNFARQGV